jgi:hypothetical protein
VKKHIRTLTPMRPGDPDDYRPGAGGARATAPDPGGNRAARRAAGLRRQWVERLTPDAPAADQEGAPDA